MTTLKTIQYLTGDATSPVGDGRKIIIHCCNNKNLWGAGFVLAISKKWKMPETIFRNDRNCKLGDVQFVRVEKDIAVANMIGQDGIKVVNDIPPIRYEAIDQCLQKISKMAQKYNASIHAPRFGAGLAKGNWTEIEKLIIKNLSEKGIEVYIYDLP